jgi:hypothetical protein
MNLDSVVRVRLFYDIECSLAELVEDWDDGEIAELLEDDPDALETLHEEAIEHALRFDPEVEEVEIE